MVEKGKVNTMGGIMWAISKGRRRKRRGWQKVGCIYHMGVRRRKGGKRVYITHRRNLEGLGE